jgi:hypothetical protein
MYAFYFFEILHNKVRQNINNGGRIAVSLLVLIIFV